MRCHAGVSNRGFTLLEVLVVVLLVAALAGITFPRIGGTQTTFALREAVNAFMSAHVLARTTAVRAGGVTELQVDSTKDRFWVEVDTSTSGSAVMDTIGFVMELTDERVDLGRVLST